MICGRWCGWGLTMEHGLEGVAAGLHESGGYGRLQVLRRRCFCHSGRELRRCGPLPPAFCRACAGFLSFKN